MESSDDYSSSRVPMSARGSLFAISLIRIGAMTSLGQFMVGATLGHSMTFGQALLATFIGSLLLEIVSVGLGIAGAREGLSTSLLARWCGFGRVGSILVGVVIALSLLGWFGVQNAMFAKSLNYASGGVLGFGLASCIAGAMLSGLVAFGFRALGWTAKIAVPLFFVVVLWSLYSILAHPTAAELFPATPLGTALTLGAGASAVAGGYIAGALVTPDLTRYCRSVSDAVWVTLASLVVGEFIVNTIAILIAHALQTDDVVTILTQTSGWVGLLTVILATVKINDFNLYSSSLAMVTTLEGLFDKRISRVMLTLVLGAIGTLLSVLGILDRFIDFLIVLGVIFPPIAGVMLVDYFVLKTHRQALDESRALGLLPAATVNIGWPALCCCAFGAAVGLLLNHGIASLNSLVAAASAYWLMGLARQRFMTMERA
ncbi:cytosine permease [Pseudomonas kitaguniensis]|uniref:cytosine permease n=1 Tax=Pseudomonas kitaguniensis TaxID=2607908 RepID=UPI003BA36328